MRMGGGVWWGGGGGGGVQRKYCTDSCKVVVGAWYSLGAQRPPHSSHTASISSLTRKSCSTYCSIHHCSHHHVNENRAEVIGIYFEAKSKSIRKKSGSISHRQGKRVVPIRISCFSARARAGSPPRCDKIRNRRDNTPPDP